MTEFSLRVSLDLLREFIFQKIILLFVMFPWSWKYICYISDFFILEVFELKWVIWPTVKWRRHFMGGHSRHPFQCNEKKSNAIFYSWMSMSKIYLKGCRGQFGTSGTSDFFVKKIFVIFHFRWWKGTRTFHWRKKIANFPFHWGKKIANFSLYIE